MTGRKNQPRVIPDRDRIHLIVRLQIEQTPPERRDALYLQALAWWTGA